MDYQVGGTGRTVVARFNDKDDIVGGITQIARKEEIRAGVVWLVGGIRKGDFVAGPEGDEMPPKPVWRGIEGNHEVVAIGTLFWEGEEPRLHLHGAFGRHDESRVGCLRKGSETFLVLEAVVLEITGVSARRELDEAVGLPLLQVGPSGD